MRTFRESFIVVFMGFFVGWFLPDCQSQAAREASAEAAYTLELTRCVDKANTLEESKACRRRVNEQWGIAETLRDAGGER